MYESYVVTNGLRRSYWWELVRRGGNVGVSQYLHQSSGCCVLYRKRSGVLYTLDLQGVFRISVRVLGVNSVRELAK